MPQPNAMRFTIASEDLPASTRPNSILSETLLQNDQIKVVLFQFAAGQELSEHTAAVPAMIHQVSGRAQWQLGNEHIEAGAGEWAYMPAKLSHSIRAVEDCSLLLLLIKSGH